MQVIRAIGDRGYPLRRYLITPVRRPATRAEAQFNESHKKTRCCIERTFGVLKSRFSCLSFGLRTPPLRASNIIVACAVLHNLAFDWDEPCFPQPIDLGLEDFNTFAGPDTADLAGSAFRQAIIANHFS